MGPDVATTAPRGPAAPMPRASVRRPAALAAVLALVLAVAGALLPAAAPAIPVPAALAPAVTRAAADDIDIATTARYVVDPATHRVRVVVDITAVNRKPNAVTRPDDHPLLLRRGQPRHPARGHPAPRDPGRPGDPGQGGEAGRLPPGHASCSATTSTTRRPRRSASRSTCRPARPGPTATCAWARRSRRSWRGRSATAGPSGSSCRRTSASTSRARRCSAPPARPGRRPAAASTQDPLGWYAWVNATNDDALTRDRLTLADGEQVVIRGWPEDRPWRNRVHALLEDGVPALVSRIGLDWPVDGALSVSEVHTPLLEGYAGFYDAESDKITISEDLDDLTIVHEASHAWFNKAPVRRALDHRGPR